MRRSIGWLGLCLSLFAGCAEYQERRHQLAQELRDAPARGKQLPGKFERDPGPMATPANITPVD